jgi:hypothetical protein
LPVVFGQARGHLALPGRRPDERRAEGTVGASRKASTMTTLPDRPRGEQQVPRPVPDVPPMPDVTPETPEQPDPKLPPMAAVPLRTAR